MKITKDLVARTAYRLWEDRGSIPGSPEQDWYAAEALLRQASSAADAATAAVREDPAVRTRYGLREFKAG